jgi:hypothetical protein
MRQARRAGGRAHARAIRRTARSNRNGTFADWGIPAHTLAELDVCDAADIPATSWDDFVKDLPVLNAADFAELDLSDFAELDLSDFATMDDLTEKLLLEANK